MSEDPVLSPATRSYRGSQYKNGRMAHTLFHLYRNAIRARLIADGIIGNDAYVVIAGPANTYAHYVTTIEEYGVQRYEGASTLFGQCESPVRLWRREISLTVWHAADTLDAYIDKYSSLLSYLADNATAGQVPPSDPAPPDLTSAAISFRVRPRRSWNPFWTGLTHGSSPAVQTGVVFDSPGIGHKFGDVLVDVPKSSTFKAGQTVSAQFVGANPRVRDF